MPKFKTIIMQAEDMNATGIVVPEEVVARLAQGKKPKAVVSLKGYSYRSTIHVMVGQVASAACQGASREGGREGRRQS